MAEDKMTLEDWLDDLCVRFIVNLGQADLSDTARICFQIEEAQWFYEDFIRPLDPQLPSMTLKQFSLKMFQHCPLFAGFSAQEHQMAFERFLQYKTRVPVRGAIMLNAAMDSAVLVRGYKKGASWSFPRGKINKDEDDLDCAVREVIEETGFDLRAAGLVDRNAPVTPVEVTMKDQQVRLYVFRDVPEDTAFAPKTRKEIGAIQWYKLSDLPAFRKKKGKTADATSADRFYMVAPFMVQLRNWIKQQKKDRPLQISMDEALTDDNVFYPHASTQNTEVEHATKEPPSFAHAAPQVLTHGQHQTAGGQEAAAAHLMALLQPGLAGAGMQQPQQHTQQQEERRQQLQYEIQQQELQVQQLHKQHMQQLHLQQHHLQQQIHQREQQQYQHQYQQYLKIEADKQQFAKQQYEQQQQQQHQQQHAYAQRDRPMAGGQQPQSPHYHPQAQRMQAQEHGQPPPATNFSAPASGHNQYRHQRPQVEVSVPVHRQMVPPQNLQREPVQLVHPQPMPAPQVVSAMVNNYGGDYVQPRSKDVSGGQKQAQVGSAPQAHLGSPSHSQGRAPAAPAQMPAHSMNLLNTLMGGASLGKSSGQQQMAQPHTAKMAQPSAQQQDGVSLRQQPESDFAPQVISGPETKPRNNANAFLPSGNPQGMNKHHSNLLDMFKVGGNTSPAGQSDTRTTPQQTASHGEKHRVAQQPVQELPTMAHVMKTAAKENGKPIKMSSETNLPYGAVAILARPQADQKPAAKEMPAPAPLPAQPQSPLRPIREPRIGSRDSSGFPSTRSSPRQIQTQSQRQVAPSQLSPQSQGLFGKLQQHGHTQSPLARMQNQGSDPVRAKSPLSQVYSPGVPYDGLTGHSMMLSTPPSTTQLGVPSTGKVRRESTAEHKQSLLSLFGQPKTGSDAGLVKAKDSYTPEIYGAGAAPRSRVASVASSTGVGHGTGTANGSRRGSQSPMSSSDRNFLLGFLQTASNKAT